MKVGGVYKFFSTKTIPPKPKWHICICPKQRLFLLINSEPFFPRAEMQIKDSDWPDMKNEVSYISCSGLLDYTVREVSNAEEGGQISQLCKDKLHDFAEASVSLSDQDIDEICIAFQP